MQNKMYAYLQMQTYLLYTFAVRAPDILSASFLAQLINPASTNIQNPFEHSSSPLSPSSQAKFLHIFPRERGGKTGVLAQAFSVVDTQWIHGVRMGQHHKWILILTIGWWYWMINDDYTILYKPTLEFWQRHGVVQDSGAPKSSASSYCSLWTKPQGEVAGQWQLVDNCIVVIPYSLYRDNCWPPRVMKRFITPYQPVS